MSISEERDRIAEDAQLTHQEQIELVKILKLKGYSNAVIAHILRVSESTIRILLAAVTKD